VPLREPQQCCASQSRQRHGPALCQRILSFPAVKPGNSDGLQYRTDTKLSRLHNGPQHYKARTSQVIVTLSNSIAVSAQKRKKVLQLIDDNLQLGRIRTNPSHSEWLKPDAIGL
jgi:hypothetical protein